VVELFIGAILNHLILTAELRLLSTGWLAAIKETLVEGKRQWEIELMANRYTWHRSQTSKDKLISAFIRQHYRLFDGFIVRAVCALRARVS